MNTKLLSHPMNWLVVWSMALIAFYVAHLLICYFYGVHPGASSTLTNGGTSSGAAGPGTVDTPSSATA